MIKGISDNLRLIGIVTTILIISGVVFGLLHVLIFTENVSKPLQEDNKSQAIDQRNSTDMTASKLINQNELRSTDSYIIKTKNTPDDLVINQWKSLEPIQVNSYGIITNGNRETMAISLTFDLCQSEGNISGYDTEIITILSDMNIPATFFAGGLWMRDHITATLELKNNQLFELGNHSWSHPDFTLLTSDQMSDEIINTQKLMWELLGWQTKLFRFPYGTYSDEALNVVAENGLYAIQWDVVSGDPDPNVDAQRMTTRVLSEVQPGSIIIMHANERGWHTAEALRVIIPALMDRGYSFVTVSELLGLK